MRTGLWLEEQRPPTQYGVPHAVRRIAYQTGDVQPEEAYTTSLCGYADDLPPVAEGMRRCKQCLKPKPVDSFVRHPTESAHGPPRGGFCAPCLKANSVARARGLTPAEVLEMVMVQQDYDLAPAETDKTVQCRFCLRMLPTSVFARCSAAVRCDVCLLHCTSLGAHITV